MARIPDVGTPEWGYWVVDQLNAISRGDISDADIFAIIGTPGSKTRRAIDELIKAGDDAVTQAMTAAIATSAQTTSVNANRYADLRAEAALRDANKYTDEHSGGGTSGVTQQYVDAADSTTLATAKSFTTTSVTEANTRTDAAIASLAEDVDAEIEVARTGAVADAKTYTDAEIAKIPSGGGGGVSEQYVNDAVAQGVSDAGTAAGLADQTVLSSARQYADNGDSGTLDASKEYTDTKVNENNSSILNEAQTMANTARDAANVYSDEANEAMADNLAIMVDGKVLDGVNESKAYTDTKIAALPSAPVSKEYVDTQDAATLNSAKNSAAQLYVPKTVNEQTVLSISNLAPENWTFAASLVRKNGFVAPEGRLTFTTSIVAVTKLFQIPDGYRPVNTRRYLALLGGGSTCRIVINADGWVDISTPVGNYTFVEFDLPPWRIA